MSVHRLVASSTFTTTARAPNGKAAVLTSLNLFYNNLGPEGGVAMAKALEVNAVLKKCDLRYNGMGEEAKAALREAVKGKEGFELLM